nr:putative reverse transcriptase domain-containing protein [Tanacetum cinerariifolium]
MEFVMGGDSGGCYGEEDKFQFCQKHYAKQRGPKFFKCEFWLREMQFLGHMINGNGIHVDPSKIEVVKNWKAPRTLTEIELFSDYDCKIRYHPGKANVVADALSRKKGLDELIERRSDEALYYLDRIWVPVKGDDYKRDRLARLYLNEIVTRNDVPILIICDRDSRFTSRFLANNARGVRNWVRHECDLPPSNQKVRKSYADKRRKPLEFSVGEHVLLKVSPWKGVVCFEKKEKLAPRFVRPSEITKRIGLVAYRLRLPEELNAQNWKLPVCYDDDDNEKRSDSLDDNIISGHPPSSAITPDEPVLSTEEPDNSLSMRDEHLDTIPTTELDEVIKSGVEDLIPILSESEGTLEHVCDVPSHDNSPPLDVSKDQIEDFSESNEEFSLTDDDSFSFDIIDFVEASPPDSELVSSEVM